MKKILIGILLTSASYAHAQTINAEQIKKDNVTIRGNAAHQLRADTSFLATRYYVDSVAGGSTFDTTSLSNRINLKVDSIDRKPGTDSVFYYTNGTEHFAYIDSVSSSTIAAAAWALPGNAGTNPAINFTGTTDNNHWSWRTNNKRWGQLRTAGQLFLHHNTDSVLYDFDSLSTNPVITGNVIIGDSNAYASGVSPQITTLDSNYLYSSVILGPKAGKLIVKGTSNTFIGAGVGYDANGLWGHAGHNPGTPFGGKYELTATGAYSCMFPGENVYESSFYGAFSGQFNKGHGVNLFGLSAGRYNKTHGLCAFGNHTFELLSSGSNGNNTGMGSDVAPVCVGPSDRNTFIGGQSALTFVSGNANSTLGALTYINATSGGNNTIVGFGAGWGLTNANQTVRIGDGAGQFLNKSLTGIIAAGFFAANATDDSSQTGFYQQYASTAATSWNKSNGMWGINDGTQGKGKVFFCEDANGYGHWSAVANDTTSGDAATINSVVGRFKKDSSGPTFTLTNSYITTNSALFLTANNAAIDATATSWTYFVGSAGVATIIFNAAPSADFKMVFRVVN